MGVFRAVVLTIDRSTALPLMYEYDAIGACFRSVGFVRVGGPDGAGDQSPGAGHARRP